MQKVLFRFQLAGVLVVSAFFTQRASAQRQPKHYTVTDLGLIGPSAGPLVITNNGLIADAVPVSNGWHAAISFQGRTSIDLGGLGGPVSSAFGVNEWGQAAGQAQTADASSEDFCGFGSQNVCEAFIWRNGVMSPLPPLRDSQGGAGKNAGAKAINILGQVGGVSENTTIDSTCPSYNPASFQFQTYQFKPVIWSNGQIQELATSGSDSHRAPFNDPDGVVFRINDRGEAVGATGTCTGNTGFSYLTGLHATLWQNGFVVDLGNLGGIAAPPPSIGLGYIGNFAYNINRSGHVVGTSGTSDGSFHAFFWSPQTLIQDVGTIPADATTPADVASIGLAISDPGEIGGVSFPAGSLLASPTAAPRAFIRPNGGTMVDLNSLIAANSALYLFTVCSINSRGELIGMALDDQGNFHGYLATPSAADEGPATELSAAYRARFDHAWSLVNRRMFRGQH